MYILLSFISQSLSLSISLIHRIGYICGCRYWSNDLKWLGLRIPKEFHNGGGVLSWKKLASTKFDTQLESESEK